LRQRLAAPDKPWKPELTALCGASSEAMLTLPDNEVLKAAIPEAEKYLPELFKHIRLTTNNLRFTERWRLL
jgi:hypothetical protein